LAEIFCARNADIVATARNINELEAVLKDKKSFPLDIASVSSIDSFFGHVQNIKFDLIIHVASLFEGKLFTSSLEDLKKWSAASYFAHALGKFALANLNPQGKLFFIGSVVGDIGHISKNCVPYSVYKGSLQLLAEGIAKEADENKKVSSYERIDLI
jgi:NAD(P)-dependent dehydrogenase (short-subunit alcohol dehydrogenase family)